MTDPARGLTAICKFLHHQGRRFALVGGLAVSLRAEIRFTRDIDLAISVEDDADAEQLVFAIARSGYQVVTTVEHKTQNRLATARLRSQEGFAIDLLFASTGIESEIVARATVVAMPTMGSVPVARSEELLAMKILSMDHLRLQDRIDAQNLLRFNPELDLTVVRDNLRLVIERGFHRDRDLISLLDEVLDEI
ncbi:MAG: nucleotidyl transferase AbiEii/AbiGii toxin family protein [Proteobacteria bacterium]|nr:nucleotidyl transferase AbiEii/AbiGii toxin family protein [Pseudomonadota bacterium]